MQSFPFVTTFPNTPFSSFYCGEEPYSVFFDITIMLIGMIMKKNSIVDNEEGRKRNLILIFILQKEEEENDDKTKILNPSHPK